LVAVLVFSVASALGQQDPVNQWGDTITGRMAPFLPKGASKLEENKNLTSIKGIGPLTGSILLSVIGDIHDFANEGKLAAYFGIVPRVSKSNETDHSGHITKRGSKLGRTALVQCALIAQR
jgi:transposase